MNNFSILILKKIECGGITMDGEVVSDVEVKIEPTDGEIIVKGKFM